MLTRNMRFEDVARITRGIPMMVPQQGRRVYDHLLATQSTDVLELGTARGVSAAYMAAALHERGEGTVITLDRADRVPSPLPEEEVFKRAPELLSHVTFVRPAHSSYVWWLKQEVQRRSDGAGNVTPLFDFCYLDGAHDFTIDGLATVLVEKLLRPGGWILLDDLNWTYAGSDVNVDGRHFSDDELRLPHIKAVFEVIVKQHPNFTEFRQEDASWVWAKKDPDAERRFTMEVTRSPIAMLVDGTKRLSTRVRNWFA
jgi:predicted O-methyltransferase YrrM